MNASQSPSASPFGPSRRWLVLLLGSMLAAVAVAAPPARADVPGRVGRISFIDGDVQSYAEADPEWKVAYVNEPVTSHNSLFVGDGGRAEITVGSTTLAVDAGSQVDVQQLDDDTFNANVVRGRVSVRVRRLDATDQYHVAVPGADFALLRPGRYRIDATEGGSGITVFEGQAGVQGDQGTSVVDAGRALRVLPAGDPNGLPELQSVSPVIASIDDWVVSRESRFRGGQAERYVSPNMTGYEDLDANGRWANESDVGPVWYPTTHVVADWAPYRYGRWAYVQPWGYTWVDDAPWGFAPFHYGRWLQIGGRWGWCPGSYVARPVYAPALVGFYGGSGFSASFSVGSRPAVGWYPLAPWERFDPHYAHGASYRARVNNIVVASAPSRFNRQGDWNRVHGGTIAPQDAFASQRSISRVVMPAPRDFAERARPVPMAALPRPEAVPGAIRRGPDPAAGITHPEFRSPREFATRSPAGLDRAAGPDRGAPPVGGVAPRVRPTEQGGLPPGYRRADEGRPGVTTGTTRPGYQPGVPPAAVEAPRGLVAPPAAADVPRGGDSRQERAADREDLRQRVPDRPAFTRPLPQAGIPAGEGQGSNMETGRFTPRSAPIPREGGASAVERIPSPGGERRFERPAPVRPLPSQPPPQVQAPQMQAPQPVERPRPVERPQFERPARIERPAPQAAPAPMPAPAPVAPPAVRAPVAPRGEPPGIERGGPNRER